MPAPTFHPIAIVGRAIALPGGIWSPDDLWQAVIGRRDCTSAVPDQRWGLSPAQALGPPPSDDGPKPDPDRAWSDRGGYVTGLEAQLDLNGLDLNALGLNEAAIRASDPLLQLTLHTAGRAVADAALPLDQRPRTGLIMGNLSFPSEGLARLAERHWWGDAAADAAGVPRPPPWDRFMSGIPALMAGRALHLGGPTFALDAACASALYAIKLACDALQDGRADAMIAGAVNRADDLFIHVGFSALKALSQTGQSRPFHADADGLLPAEGAGFVVLQRLEDALAERRTIHGVIRGVGLSNDGRGRGLLVPSRAGQARAMSSAWEQAGLDPASLGLLECHATGTVVGDATELLSCTDALGQRPDALPIGSLKSNLGHLITAAGVAGLVKVLEAQRRSIRPPSLHSGTLNATLADVPLRVVEAPEQWTGSRRAAVNAFGFGGNNAHLIVEPLDPAAPPAAPTPAAQAAVAVVALSARVGDTIDTAGFGAACAGAPAGPTLDTVDVALKGLRFPPTDLQQTLGQQLAVLAAARDLAPLTEAAIPEKTGIFVGMGADPEVARYGARWRVAAHSSAWQLDSSEVSITKDTVVPALQSAGVLGTMPNIPANRVSSQLDLRGPGFVVSAEEASGLVALEVGARMVATGELDLALAGAVDLSCDGVHEAALAALRPSARSPGDAAVLLGLQRYDDAIAQGNPVLALLGNRGDSPAHHDADAPDDPLLSKVGRAHAAYPLVRLAQAVLDLATGASENDDIVVQVTDLSGRTHAAGVCRGHPLSAPLPAADPRALRLPARRLSPPQLPSHRPTPAAPPPAPPVVTGTLPYVEQSIVPANTPDPSRVQAMPPAPALPAVTALPPAEVRGPAPRPPVLQAAVPLVVQPAANAHPAVQHTSDSIPGRWAGALQQLGEMHRQYLADQATLHQRFLALRSHGSTAAIQLGQVGAMPPQVPVVPPQVPAVPPSATTQAAAPVAPRIQPAPAPRSPVPMAKAPQAPPPRPSAPTVIAASPVAALVRPTPSADLQSTSFKFTKKRTPTGLTLSREQLHVHASGNISEIYGPQFQPQDAYTRQCRMPEPPLLLADRVVGLDAEPASMGLGTIWTETDITEDAWYLHDGRIPAGVLIESGQADLMLISYLGIDLQHSGDRVYRLLGCTLTYHGDLPKVGETIRYDIHVDGHVKHGDVRLFFFHYDCFTTDESAQDGLARPILSVRGGQAGFFTDAELADSAGILWTAEEQELAPNPTLDAPVVSLPAKTYTPADLAAYAEGRPWECFGPEFDSAKPHVWTPRFQTEHMLFLRGPAELDPQGGPWKRGYLKVTVPIEADEWYFDGHFKNDPCMPGTLMFEGCLQAMAFYLASTGVTLKRDGWRFQPVTGEPFDLKCRGQVDPGTRLLTYEIFVEEFVAGPVPTLYADLLCTSDGLKAFHARRVGLQLVPDWPMSRLPAMVEKFPDAHVKVLLDKDFVDPVPAAEADGFKFGYHSMAACAWGKPSEAFGPMYARYDGGAHVARLPGEPYHFMTRTTHIDGLIGSFKAGNAIEIEYDVPPDAWYFRENDTPTMPFCVFLEAALQPCGWLACFVGSTLTSDEPLFFRNLDGTGTMRAEIVPTAGTFRTKVTLTNISRAGAMIIQSFDVQCLVGDTVVYDLKTVFGFFPGEALANQVGLPCTDADFALLTESCDEKVLGQPLPLDLKARPAEFFEGSLRLPGARLCLLDRLTGWWPEGGEKGLGRLRAEKDVDSSEWYFKAHFYSDPVQPGSLGIEALIRLLQLGCLLKGMGDGMANPRFEPLRIGEESLWRYRGQVIPTNKVVSTTLDIIEAGEDDIGRYLVAEGSLWVDGKRIYETRKMGMRVVDGGPTGPSSHEDDNGPEPVVSEPEVSDDSTTDAAFQGDTFTLDSDGWLADHRPTWTTPAVPMMVVADLLTHGIQGDVTAVRDVAVRGWLTVDGTRRLRREHRHTPAGTLVRLLDADSGDELARGTVDTGRYASSPASWTTPALPTQPDPYTSGDLFHGPAFQVLTELRRGPGIASGTLDLSKSTVPIGRLAPALLDGATHLVPHDALADWGAQVPSDTVSYPARLTELRVYGPTPSGQVSVIAKLDGNVGGLPRLRFQWSSEAGVWAEATLLEAPFPLGPIGTAPVLARRRFLAERRFDPAVRLSKKIDDQSVLDIRDIDRSDWLPGTVEAIYGTTAPAELLRREHIAHAVAASGASVHPGSLPASLPLLRSDVVVDQQGDIMRARTLDLGLDVGPVRNWWADYFGRTGWPTEDLYYGLIEKFVRQVIIEDPTAFAAVRGRPALFLANHQTAVESLLFSIVVSALIETPTVTVAKTEHQDTWLGHLIRQGFSWPGVNDPQVITYFDRADKASLMGVIARLHHGLRSRTNPRSAMVHVEGTRAFDCTEPVRIMSGKFIDLALEADVPIIPVRFSGGLPRQPLTERTEFAIGMGRQDIWLGRPMRPAELAPMPYGERKKAVLNAMNALGPSPANEHPLPPAPHFAARVEAWRAHVGCSEEHATLWIALQDIPNPSPPISRLLAGADLGALRLASTEEDRWLAVLASWVYGDRGPTLVS